MYNLDFLKNSCFNRKTDTSFVSLYHTAPSIAPAKFISVGLYLRGVSRSEQLCLHCNGLVLWLREQCLSDLSAVGLSNKVLTFHDAEVSFM